MLLIYPGILICIFILNRIPYIFFLHSYLPVLKHFAAFTQPPISPVQNQISSLQLLFCYKAGSITHPNSKSGSMRAQVLASRLSLLHPTTPILSFLGRPFPQLPFATLQSLVSSSETGSGLSLWWITVSPGHPAGDRFLPAPDCFPTKLQ